MDKKRKFYSNYERPPGHSIKNSGKLIVERAGYIPPRVMIQQMVSAGQNLQAHRERMVDTYLDDVPDDFHDPTRSPGYDLVDAGRDFQAGQEATERIIKQTRAELERKAKESKDEGRSDRRSKSSDKAGESDNLSETAEKVTEAEIY